MRENSNLTPVNQKSKPFFEQKIMTVEAKKRKGDREDRSSETVEDLEIIDTKLQKAESDFDLKDIEEEPMMQRNVIMKAHMNSLKDKMSNLQDNKKQSYLQIAVSDKHD